MSSGDLEALFREARNLCKEETPILDVDGRKYSREDLDLITGPMASPVLVSSLEALVTLCQHDSSIAKSAPLIVHIEGPETVRVQRELDENRLRESLIHANFRSRFVPNKWMDLEEFNTQLLVHCEPSADRDRVLAYTGNVRNEAIHTMADDGVTQTAVVSKGIKSNQVREPVPLEVTLTPRRSFPVIKQVESPFILRLRESGRTGGVEAALFEVDGGAWDLVAMERLSLWLHSAFGDPAALRVLIVW